jgi:hypothetical protein
MIDMTRSLHLPLLFLGHPRREHAIWICVVQLESITEIMSTYLFIFLVIEGNLDIVEALEE